jgi:tetratricopeptide (TPR) repeat protein
MAPGDKLLEEQILWVSKKKAILDRDQTMQEILNRATASFERGEYEQSLLDWRSLVILQPDNTDFQKKLVACQDKLRQSKTAKAMRLAQVSLQKGALTEASQHYLEVLEIDPGNKESLEQLKKIQDQLRSRMEDKNTLSRTVTASKPANLAASPVTHSSPKLSDDQYTLGLIYYSQGDMPKARIAFESALNYDPANQKAKNALARLKAEVEP